MTVPHKNNEQTDIESEELTTVNYNDTIPKATKFNRKSILIAVMVGFAVIAFSLFITSINKKEKPKTDDESKPEISNAKANVGDRMDKMPSNYGPKPDTPDLSKPNPATDTNNAPIDLSNKVDSPNTTNHENPYHNFHYDDNKQYSNNYQSENNPLREQKLKEAEELRAARKSPIKFSIDSKEKKSNDSSAENINTKLASALGSTQMPNMQMPNLNQDTDQNKQEQKLKFLDRERTNPIYLQQSLKTPISPYQVMAGSIIPCNLITGINSDLPGQIIGQVRENVYDTVTGSFKLIPQGTKVIGEYSSQITYGQSRLLVVWTRLIFRNGTSISLEGMPGVDLSGYAGLSDQTDYHMWKLAGATILSTVFGVGAQVAAGNSAAGTATFQQQAASAFAQKSTEVGGKIIDKTLEIQPTLMIRPGQKFNIYVNRDIILKPYR